MSQLFIYANHDGTRATQVLNDHAEIAAVLNSHDVLFERWQANAILGDDATSEQITAAYQADIDRLNARFGFQSIDVVSLTPDNPNKDAARQKFLAEHTHDDFEIRFFVDGGGLFYLHMDGKVLAVHCTRGDLISVPANTTHWFDMGSAPYFKAIRLFTTPDGWVDQFTGSDIANRFPSFDQLINV